MRYSTAFFAAVSLFAAAAASAQAPVIDRSTGGDNALVVTESMESSAAVAPQLSMDERIVRLERLLESQTLVDMLTRIDSLTNDSQELQGAMEELVHSIDEMKQRQRDLYLDIDRRLRQTELAAKAVPQTASGVTPSLAAPLPGVGVSSSSTPSTMATTEPADPALEREAYQRAFAALKEGRYEPAIKEFQGFLVKYPTGSYTDNAQYWLGEANYVTRRFTAAEVEFKKVVNGHPDSPKVADAMLKLGYTYYELGNWDAARQTLEGVSSQYPKSTVSRLAENRLQKMRLEGR